MEKKKRDVKKKKSLTIERKNPSSMEKRAFYRGRIPRRKNPLKRSPRHTVGDSATRVFLLRYFDHFFLYC